jgi:hypothetical protein
MKSMGLHKSFGVSASEQEGSMNISQRDRLQKTWKLLVQEAKAVSLWSLLSMFLRILLVWLGTMNAGSEGSSSSSLEGLFSGSLGSLKELVMMASFLAGWILELTPSKVPIFQAPGFIFANPWYAVIC